MYEKVDVDLNIHDFGEKPPCKTKLISRPEFRFDERDIRRIRTELGTLFTRLAAINKKNIDMTVIDRIKALR